jgi:cellulose synthase/poly-beta-1,6-N-acetylglucosamine synthase-like glycosyltransferase
LVLAYVFCGYPLLLALWTHVAPRPVRSQDATPSVCVLVAAHNEATVIADKVRNTLALDYPRDRFDILIVSDGSTDSTAAIVQGFASDGVRLIALDRRGGKTGAVVEAMRHVTSDIVVISDANAFLRPDALKRLAACFSDDRVGAVSGDVVLVGDRAALATGEDLYYRYERWIQRAESAIGSTIGVDGGLYALRRSLFRPPPLDTILDDVVIPMTVVEQGYRVVFEPAAGAVEQGSRSAWEEFSRKSRVVAGAVQFLGRFDGWRACPPQVIFSLVSHKALRWLSPLFAFLFVVTTLARTPVGWYPLLAIVQVVALAIGALGCWPAARRWKVVGVFHYSLLVLAAAAAGLVRGLAGRQSVTWQRFERVPVTRT